MAVANTGWVIAGTGTSDQGNASFPYSNPSFITDENLSLSAVWSGAKFNNGDTPENGITLKATNFSFSVPVSATIVGIETKARGTGSHAGEMAYLGQVNSSPDILPYGVEKINHWGPPVSITSPGGEEFIWGSPTDLWGTNDLTPALVNTSTFGWVYMIWDSAAPLSSGITTMHMKIYYDIPETAGMMGAGF